MELAEISRPRQIPVSNGYWHVSNRYRARLQYPMDTGASPIYTGAERELVTHCQDPLEGSFCHNSANPLFVIKAKAICSRSNYIEIKNSTMTFQASWKALFNLLTTVNKSSNRNIAGFTGAMDFEAKLDIKMMQLNKPYSFLLVANSMKEITILHNLHNFGGTLFRSTNKVGCLIGTGPTSIPVIVVHQAALHSIQEIVPSIKDINNCPTVDELASIPIPSANGGSLVNLKALRSFFPAPFLCNAILATNLPSPLALILAVRVA